MPPPVSLVQLKSVGKHIGNVRLGPIYILSKVCKFSMMIGDESYHSKGYGTEIVRACIEYVFNND